MPVRTEDSIRSLLGKDGQPVPGYQQWTPLPPIQPSPPLPMATGYSAGMRYKGEGEIPDGNTPTTHPDEWEESVTLKPPSKRERIAEALQKRRAMGLNGGPSRR